MLAVIALALATGCGGGAHAQAGTRAQGDSTSVYLAQAQCGPTDSTVSCCVKTHPGSPERCGLTEFEAANILRAVKAASDLSEEDLPEWKRYCMGEYVKCQEKDWLGPCYECFRYCEGQQGEWPTDRCRRRQGGN
ncbi:hypothetical protein OV208_18470 [Corallococcus sp. bb12-1]|uniref:hypothetical protein n=1 Tax=Corallococcus sp. bb12-1 TaxID=2996784 RepID=UPI00226F91C5|nr:hypothetical protein [Corallococcus sp. bb12-1]MCY1043308.1 hypothetical protein [Corallococcus sp. bb12-1]